MLKPNRLLIVDRDESTRALLRELCESWNFSVTLARDGNEAVQLLLANGFQAVRLEESYLDIKLPDN